MTPEADALEFAKLAQALQAAPTPAATAQEIVEYVRGQLDANHAGLTLIQSRRRLKTVAATDISGLGIASVLAVELTTVDDRRIGSINVYWTRRRTSPPTTSRSPTSSPGMPRWPCRCR